MNDARITYIYLYVDGEVRYIMNRSIPFVNIIGRKRIKALEALGENQYVKIMSDLENELQSLDYRLKPNSQSIAILETHAEWKNVNRENQKEINRRKQKLAEIHNAVVSRKSIEIDDIETNIKQKVLCKITHMFEETVKVLLPFVKEEYKEDYDLFTKEVQDLLDQYHCLQDDIKNECLEHEQKIERYNVLYNLESQIISFEKQIDKLKKEEWRIKNEVYDWNKRLEKLQKCIDEGKKVLYQNINPKIYTELYTEELRETMRNKELKTIEYLKQKQN